MLRRTLLVLLSALTAGCLTAPDLTVLDRPDLAKPYAESSDRGAPAGAPGLGKTLTVDQAIEVALINNPDLGQAIARIRQARARLALARSPFLPSLDANVSYTKYLESSMDVNFGGAGFELPSNSRIGVARGNEFYGTGLDATWNLFAGGRDWQNYAASREQRDGAANQAERVKKVIENAVRRAFYQALLARDAIEISNASVAFSSRELKDAKARYDVGRGLKTDVLTFETRMLDAQVQVTEAENSHRLALISLGELMAMALPDDIELTMPASSGSKWEKMAEEQVVQTAWQQRRDLAALRNDYASARRQVAAAKAEWFPQVNATGKYEVSHRNSPDFRQDEDDLTVGVGVTWNLYRGGDTVAAIAAARHTATEKAESHRRLKLSIRTEVSNALTNIKNARRRVELGEKMVASAEESLKLLAERYRAGAITISQVTEGELRLSEARLDLIQARIDLLNAQSELRLALGEA